MAFIFLATIVVPGVVLAVYGFRALYFERRIAHQQIREALEASTITMERRLELEFASWRDVLEHPDRISKLAPNADSIVMLAKQGGHLRVSPSGALLYDLVDHSGTIRQNPPARAESRSL